MIPLQPSLLMVNSWEAFGCLYAIRECSLDFEYAVVGIILKIKAQINHWLIFKKEVLFLHRVRLNV